MSTRGIYGFHKNGEDKLTYNHFDSYPEGLGKNITDCLLNLKLKIKNKFIPTLNKVFDNIVMVEEKTSVPKNLEINEFDWYTYLRSNQGDLNYLIDKYFNNEECYMINNKDFIKDSLFCEFGYIINLDTKKFEIYKGGQEQPTSKHRYYVDEPTTILKLGNNFYNCELIKEYSLTKIPKEWYKNYDK